MAGIDHWFFLSYARTDRDVYLDQFFTDLAQAVKKKAALASSATDDEVGFVDSKGLRVGRDWPDELREALLGSRVLVPLYSRAYLTSEYCGRELEVFRRRLAGWSDNGGGGEAPPLAMPVMWDKPAKLPRADALPPVLRPVQWHEDALGAAYAAHGLLRLVQMKEGRHHDDYIEFLDAFAELLVDVGEANALPRCDDTIPPLASLTSALLEQVNGSDAAAPATPRGVATAQFVFVAGRRDELAAIRPDADGYGSEGGRDWCPFHPAEPVPVGVLSQMAASHERLFYEDIPLDADLEQRLEKAEEENTIVLLIVDPWSTRLDHYKQRLGGYDKRRWINSQVLVLWNLTADGPVDQGQLRAWVGQALARLSSMESSVIREGAISTETFEQGVIDAINEVRTRLARMGRITQPIAQAGSDTLPVLNATARE